MNLGEKLKKLNAFFKKGSMDVLIFVMMTPFILLLFAVLTNTVTTSEFNQQLEYATYAAGRAAVCSGSMKDARKNARTAAQANMATEAKYLKGELEDAVEVTVQYYNKETTKRAKTKEKEAREWDQGHYIICTVTAKYNPIGISLGDNTKTCRMVMAIEYEA